MRGWWIVAAGLVLFSPDPAPSRGDPAEQPGLAELTVQRVSAYCGKPADRLGPEARASLIGKWYARDAGQVTFIAKLRADGTTASSGAARGKGRWEIAGDHVRVSLPQPGLGDLYFVRIDGVYYLPSRESFAVPLSQSRYGAVASCRPSPAR